MSFVVPESETPETDAEYEANGHEIHVEVDDGNEVIEQAVDIDFARSLERRLSLAQTEIKGHVRREEDLKVRIAELEETRAVLKSQMDDWLAENHKTLAARDNAAARADQAQSRIAELEKDAARYRWLRQWANRGDELAALNLKEPETPEDIDAAIDAALKARA